MGFFSWKTINTNKSISNKHSIKGALPVKMLDNKGNVFIELDYDGYGVFGGKDFYELVAEMNGLKDRKDGIDLEQHDEGTVLLPKIVTLACNEPWGELDDNENCPEQGFFYEDPGMEERNEEIDEDYWDSIDEDEKEGILNDE